MGGEEIEVNLTVCKHTNMETQEKIQGIQKVILSIVGK